MGKEELDKLIEDYMYDEYPDEFPSFDEISAWVKSHYNIVVDYALYVEVHDEWTEGF